MKWSKIIVGNSLTVSGVWLWQLSTECINKLIYCDWKTGLLIPAITILSVGIYLIITGILTKKPIPIQQEGNV